MEMRRRRFAGDAKDAHVLFSLHIKRGQVEIAGNVRGGGTFNGGVRVVGRGVKVVGCGVRVLERGRGGAYVSLARLGFSHRFLQHWAF